jgi:ABC-type branched-subunit amino acid transport system permease subunit
VRGPLAALVTVVIGALVVPDEMLHVAAGLAVLAVLGVGAWLSLRRIGLVDLATGAAAGAGASVGAVGATLTGLPVAAGLPVGVALGALIGALVGAVGARTGRVLGSLASLALGLAVVGAIAAWLGAAGFHGIARLTGGDRGDLVVTAVVAVAAVVTAGAAGRQGFMGRAAVAARAPHIASSLGRRPSVDAAWGGALAGAVLGLGGVLGASVSGSIVADGYGLVMSAGLALAALVGGGLPVGGVIGALVVFGPGALVGGAAPMLVTATIGLAVLAVRPAGLLPQRSAPIDPPREDTGATPPEPRHGGISLEVRDAPLPGGGRLSFDAHPGEIVCLAGPNGAGKSTLIAMVAGEIDDGGHVLIAGRIPPRGAVLRARAGVARSWQRPPSLDRTDGMAAAAREAADLAAARWAGDLLGEGAEDDAREDLVRVAARRPGLVLLDEPAGRLEPAAVVAFARALVDGGATVVIAEHRTEIIGSCDRVVEVTP